MNLQLVHQYILSLSQKMKICFTKKQKTKTKGTIKKKRKKKSLSARVEPRPTDVEGLRVIYSATTTNIEKPSLN